MALNRQYVIAAALCAVFSQQIWPQTPRFATVEIEWENNVTYFADTSDPTKFATSAAMVAPSIRNFMTGTAIADVVSINGKPAKGTWVGKAQVVLLSASPMPGQAIGDIGRPILGDIYIEILEPDGTRVGTITGVGSPAGTAPPGAPAEFVGNLTVTGGTGAFLGVCGMLTGPPFTARAASIQEDPANRRTHGGGRGKYIVSLIPMSWPEIVSTANGPGVFHADFNVVTPNRPARAGETLILMAAGLGPTRPGLSTGTQFPNDPYQEVNSPVEVVVNGRSAEVVNAIGWPGTSDRYRVDIKVPAGTPSGMAAVQITAGFIPGRPVSIPIE